MGNNSKVSNSTGLESENQRLKAQLDREIKINRKMKSALEKYANSDYWFVGTEFDGDCVFLYKPNSNGYEIAQQVLKKLIIRSKK